MGLAEYLAFFDSPYPSKRGDLYGPVQAGPRVIEWDSWICDVHFASITNGRIGSLW